MLKLLTTFRVVYETRNFSRTAELLFLSQPAVSNQVKQLERELGVTLFERNGRKEMKPTKQADLLYERALILMEEWQETQQQLLDEQNEEEVCRIVASHTFAVYLLPKLLKYLLPKYPKINFVIAYANSHNALDQVAKHEADFGFIEKPLETSGVQRFSLMDDELVIAGDPDGELWFVRESTSGVFHYTQRYFEEKNIHGKKLLVKSNEVIAALLKEGICCSILSKRAVPNGVPTKALDYHRNFYLIQRTNLVSENLQSVAKEILIYNELYKKIAEKKVDK
ncbi:MAG: LysR family transcriptional regulator [Enterococcus lacertideformus]|uniref:LysR family transcriptional regulator n=1 Tax=Enterococcus lacertideformus TaxID=2771493 RepID=A0A931AXP7_9ENTE|nr:LysR family transcriptional regulator [Enterococcus lacertideformus]